MTFLSIKTRINKATFNLNGDFKIEPTCSADMYEYSEYFLRIINENILDINRLHSYHKSEKNISFMISGSCKVDKVFKSISTGKNHVFYGEDKIFSLEKKMNEVFSLYGNDNRFDDEILLRIYHENDKIYINPILFLSDTYKMNKRLNICNLQTFENEEKCNDNMVIDYNINEGF